VELVSVPKYMKGGHMEKSLDLLYLALGVKCDQRKEDIVRDGNHIKKNVLNVTCAKRELAVS